MPNLIGRLAAFPHSNVMPAETDTFNERDTETTEENNYILPEDGTQHSLQSGGNEASEVRERELRSRFPCDQFYEGIQAVVELVFGSNDDIEEGLWGARSMWLVFGSDSDEDDEDTDERVRVTYCGFYRIVSCGCEIIMCVCGLTTVRSNFPGLN